jgi:nitroreductase
MDFKNLIKLLKERRTIRQFKPDSVSDEHVLDILEASRWAPSGGNSQPWEFVIIKDPVIKNKIVDLYVEYTKYSQKIEVTRKERLRFPSLSTSNLLPGFKDAPVYIVVCGDTRTIECYPLAAMLERGEKNFNSSLASAVLNMHLAATTLGLAFQWVSASASPFMESNIKKILGIPPLFKIYDLIAIGYPGSPPKPKYLRKLREMIHWEKYDLNSYRSDEDIMRFIEQCHR